MSWSLEGSEEIAGPCGTMVKAIKVTRDSRSKGREHRTNQKDDTVNEIKREVAER